MRLRRLACRMSQQQLAAALGVTFQQVQKYERGANRISASRLQAVARVLRVPVAAFYEAPPEAEAALWTDPEALRLAEAFGAIRDRRLRRQARVLVETLVRLGA